MCRCCCCKHLYRSTWSAAIFSIIFSDDVLIWRAASAAASADTIFSASATMACCAVICVSTSASAPANMAALLSRVARAPATFSLSLPSISDCAASVRNDARSALDASLAINSSSWRVLNRANLSSADPCAFSALVVMLCLRLSILMKQVSTVSNVYKVSTSHPRL